MAQGPRPSKPKAVTVATLRRVALARQGLLAGAPFGRGANAVARTLEQLGYLQIDTISVVERAHHHTLWSRVPGYRPALLDRALAHGTVFEYWFHAASYLPMRDYRFALPRMHAMRRGELRWIRSRDRKLMQRVLDRIRLEGPLRARDFDAPNHRSNGWWDWKPAKRALEQLFMQGDLMCAGREGFQKVYDLPERVLPSDVDTREPTLDELAAYLADTALRAHGFAEQKQMLYLRQGAPLREATRRYLDARLADGTLEKIALGNGRVSYADPAALANKPRLPPATVKLLSPFDNAVIHRERTQALHDFDYQLECYVPAAKRRFGYFCLPVLYRDRLVGRIDCKAHRKQRRLELVHVHIEHEIGDRERFVAALGDAVHEFAGFNQCDDVNIVRASPRHWQRALKRL